MPPEEKVTSGVMGVPRVERPNAPRQRAPEPPEPRYPLGDEVDPKLWQLYQELNLGDRFRVEFLEDRIVVRGTPAFGHEHLLFWLGSCLLTRCMDQGWVYSTNSALELPGPASGIRPDFLVVRDPHVLPRAEGEVDTKHVLLVAEIVSPGSRRDDRDLKPLSCARADIPYFLLIDEYSKPPTITLLASPSEDGYRTVDAVPMGKGGGELRLPSPFSVTLDATTAPLDLELGLTARILSSTRKGPANGIQRDHAQLGSDTGDRRSLARASTAAGPRRPARIPCPRWGCISPRDSR